MTAPREALPAAESTDGALVAAVLSGETTDYSVLVRRHQELLYRHLLGMGLDRDTSLDLVQEAFVRAHARLATCRQPEHFRAWVFRICRNLCLDHLKAAARREVPLDALPEGFAATTDDPELRLTLQAALARLSTPLREAFLLRHAAGHEYQEIAALLETTPSAAKMRVHRAREELQAFLVGQGVTPGGVT